MTGGTEIQETVEAPQEKMEISEAKDQLDRASTDPEGTVEKTSDYKEAEAVQGALVETVNAVEASAKIEAAPTITLDGAEAAGRMTIGTAAEQTAIIDSNDGTSREAIIDSNDGPSAINAAGVVGTEAVIDSNDGTNTVGIIDSNDREVIIDSNDGTSREAIGTWPTPEVLAEGADTEGDNPPPPGDGKDPVSPTNNVQPVASVQGRELQNDMNFSKEMEGAKPGEVRGFENEDGTKVYVLKTDGQASDTPAAEYIFNQDSIDITSQELGELPMEAEVAELPPDTGGMAEKSDFSQTLKQQTDNPLLSDQGESSAEGSMSAGSKKALGFTPSAVAGIGLPLDDNFGDGAENPPAIDTPSDEDTSKDSDDDGSDSPTPPPAPGTGTGVSPNLSGPESTEGGDSAPVISTSRAEVATSEAISTIGDGTGPGSAEYANPIYVEGSDPLAQRNMELMNSIGATTINEDNRYFLDRLRGMNETGEAMDGVLENMNEKTQLESMIGELYEKIASYNEVISRFEGYINVLNQEISMLENTLENMDEGDTVTITHHRYSQQWGNINWDVVTVEMDSTMIEDLIQNKYRDITNINGRTNILRDKVDIDQALLSQLLDQYEQLGFDSSDIDYSPGGPSIESTEGSSQPLSSADLD